MKYEIIKGSENDFEWAPEWAMQVESLIDSNTLFYTEAINGSQTAEHLCQWGDESISRPLAHSANSIGGGFTVIAQRRPITEPVVNQQLTTEWDGEGLPPVGCHCEVKTGKDSWNLCKVVFSDNVAGVAFVYLGGDEENYVGSVDCIGAQCAPSYFRVMRSSEDSVMDEAKGIIAELCRSSASNGHSADLIYDAIAAGRIKGITKTPTVSELMRVTENATREDCEAIVKMMGGAK